MGLTRLQMITTDEWDDIFFYEKALYRTSVKLQSIRIRVSSIGNDPGHTIWCSPCPGSLLHHTHTPCMKHLHSMTVESLMAIIVAQTKPQIIISWIFPRDVWCHHNPAVRDVASRLDGRQTWWVEEVRSWVSVIWLSFWCDVTLGLPARCRFRLHKDL